MRITLPATYRLPNGRAMSGMVAKLFALQRREVLAYVRSGRTSPINLNGWIDYTTEKLLPYYLWHVAEGWKITQQRLQVIGGYHLNRKAMVKADQGTKLSLENSAKTKEKDDKKKLGLLALIALMGSDVLADVKAIVRKVVTGILATSAKQVNRITTLIREIEATGGSRLQRSEVDAAVSEIFTKPARIKLIGEDEAIRAYHYGMVRVLQASKYRWMKTWRTSKIEPEKTCKICLPLDGVTIPIDQTFMGHEKNGTMVLANAPPMHPVCRCRLEIYIDIDPAQVAVRTRRELVGA